jgi:hypothetical protein
MANDLRFAARILIRKGNIEAAHRVLERVYSQATAEQIDLQVFLVLVGRALAYSLNHLIASGSPCIGTAKYRHCKFYNLL